MKRGSASDSPSPPKQTVCFLQAWFRLLFLVAWAMRLCPSIWCSCHLRNGWKLEYLGFGSWIVLAASLCICRWVCDYRTENPFIWKSRGSLQTRATKGVRKVVGFCSLRVRLSPQVSKAMMELVKSRGLQKTKRSERAWGSLSPFYTWWFF